MHEDQSPPRSLEEPQSVEYIEDPYFIRLESHATPSFDEDPDQDEIETWSRLSPTVHTDLQDHDDDSFLCVETEFVTHSRHKARLLIFKRKIRDVRVTFQDLSKPYLAKISSQNNYKKFLGLSASGGCYEGFSCGFRFNGTVGRIAGFSVCELCAYVVFTMGF